MAKKKQSGAKKKHTNEDYSIADAIINQRMQLDLERERSYNKRMGERADAVFYGLLTLAGLMIISFTPAAIKACRYGLQCSHSQAVKS